MFPSLKIQVTGAAGSNRTASPCQCAVQPPSTGSAVPVIDAAASLRRNTASAPISSTVAKRLFGCCASSTSWIDLLARHVVRLGLAVDLRLDQRRPDIAGADGVAGDAGFGDFERRHLGEADDAVLGRDIGRLERRGDEAVRRGDVDDAAPLARPHRRAAPARVVWNADDRLMARIASHFADRELLDRRHELDAGVVDEDVDLAERLERLRTCRRSRGLGHVGAVIATLTPCSEPILAAPRDLLGLAEAVEHDVGAGRGERPGDAEADAAGRAGDQGNLALERAGGLFGADVCLDVHGCGPFRVTVLWRCDRRRRHGPCMDAARRGNAGWLKRR